MSDSDVLGRLLDAAKAHVPFDGWSDATFRAAISDAGVDEAVALAACPRGAVGLALAYHEAGDAEMLKRLAGSDLSDMRFRDKVTLAVRLRLEAIEDKELVRRGMALFSLPHYAPEGVQAVWRTSDRIWTALGDNANDINWYTKRMTLSGVYSATVLFWIGDTSDGHENSWAFLGRRIDDVMQIEKIKAQLRENKLVDGLMAGPLAFLGRIKPPQSGHQTRMPGRWNGPN